MKEVAKTLGDTLTRLYPESTLIEYLLSAKSPVLMTVEEYIKIHSTIPLIKLYAGNNVIYATFFFCWSRFLISVQTFNSLKIKMRMQDSWIKTIIYFRVFTISKKRLLFMGYMKFVSEIAKLITYTNFIRMVYFPFFLLFFFSFAKSAGQAWSLRRTGGIRFETVLPCTLINPKGFLSALIPGYCTIHSNEANWCANAGRYYWILWSSREFQ